MTAPKVESVPLPDHKPSAPDPQRRWMDAELIPLPALEDAEGDKLPEQLPPVVDAHVHLFPPRVFAAIWRWFDSHAWPIRYKLKSEQVIDFLFQRGVSRFVALHYAHKPGMSRALNQYVAELCRREPRIIGLATVMPGEPGAVEILKDAFASGLKGVKLHCHVQCFSPDEERVEPIYRACEEAGLAMVMHAGRQPSSQHYLCDTQQLCSAARIERVLESHPRLKLCVPHLGADEFDTYQRLLERYDNLWLDTTMAIADYFPAPTPIDLIRVRPERILYGTDFPNLPYAWDRELKRLIQLGLSSDAEAKILGQNALSLFE
jgi:uncharacterized protein